MAHAWCFLLLIIHMCGLSSSVPRQFHVVKVDKTWQEAQQYCRDEFTDLATIDDMGEMEKVNNMIHDAMTQDANGVTWGATWGPWIGLKNGEWQWSLADERYYLKEGEDMGGYYWEDKSGFRSWGDGRPEMKDKYCVVLLKGSSKWLDWQCESNILFVCYDSKNSTHPFVFVNEHKPWADAQAYCREKYTDLASVRDQEENTIMGSFVENVWIGLFRNDWEWSDDSTSTFQHWLPGSPSYEDDDPEQDGLCAEIWSSGRWNDKRCDKLRHFVCYEAQPTVEVVSPQSPFYSGDVVTLRCNITDYTAQQKYAWLKDNSPVAGETGQTIAITLPVQYQCHRHRDGSSVLPYMSDPVDIVITGPRVIQVVRVALKVPPGVNVEDSGLQAAILREIGQRLKATGMSDAHLTWRKPQP